MKNPHPPKIRHIAAMWSMVQYPHAKKEWSLERKIRAVKEAGFDGFATQPGPEHKRLAEKLGLIIVGYVATGKAAEFQPLLLRNKENGAHHINVQLADEDTLTPEALRLTLRLMKEAKALGVEAAVEIHRDTCTETPEKAYALADAYRKAAGEYLPMTLDYSHVAVVKHLHPGNYAARILVQPKLIQRVSQIHLRPFNGHHCQIPVTDGKGNLTREIKDWLPFAEALFRVWRAGKQDGRELFVVPEMGPVPGGYNLYSLPNSWDDAIVLKGLIQKAWLASAR
ncbi:MAG: xylose isomerase [Verrucomicrobiota bacterium]